MESRPDAYEIVATSNRGRELSPEVLGDAHGQVYPQLIAEKKAVELQNSVSGVELDPSTEYTIEQVGILCESCLNNDEYTLATGKGTHENWCNTYLCDECNAAYVNG